MYWIHIRGISWKNMVIAAGGNFEAFFLPIFPFFAEPYFYESLDITGWWYTYPSEKYDFVNGKDDIPCMKWKIKFMVWNHQKDIMKV